MIEIDAVRHAPALSRARDHAGLGLARRPAALRLKLRLLGCRVEVDVEGEGKSLIVCRPHRHCCLRLRCLHPGAAVLAVGEKEKEKAAGVVRRALVLAEKARGDWKMKMGVMILEPPPL